MLMWFIPAGGCSFLFSKYVQKIRGGAQTHGNFHGGSMMSMGFSTMEKILLKPRQMSAEIFMDINVKPWAFSFLHCCKKRNGMKTHS